MFSKAAKSAAVLLPAAAFFRKYCLCQAVGSSMQPEIEGKGEVYLCQRVRALPSRNTVVVARSPDEPSKRVCKRLVGIPGDTLFVSADRVQVVGADGFVRQYLGHANTESSVVREVVLNEGRIWLQGDNNEASVDSRDYGPVSASSVLSVPLKRLSIPSRFRFWKRS